MKKITTLLFLAVLVLSHTRLMASQVLTYRSVNSETDDMVVSLLHLIVAKANSDLTLVSSNEIYTDERAMAELDTGKLSVYWTVTSIENEQRMLPIRYPIDKGLLGYRIFIIKNGNQERFDKVKAVEDLKNFTAGQGYNWPDTKILRNAGLSVVTAVKYKNLFAMLDGARFDYFPRGVFEPWSEVQVWSQYPLTVEKTIVLKYPAALYFFVSKDNNKLADILSKGFEHAISDGSYDEMFYSSSPVREAVEKSNLQSRIVININNPLLPPNTPLARKELWFNPLR